MPWSLAFDAPDQMRAGINMTYTALLATTYYVVKSVLDPTIPPNAGLARAAHRHRAREGSILNCTAPAAVNGRLQTCQRVADMVLGAPLPADPGTRDGLLELGLHRRLFHRPAATGWFRRGSTSRRSAAAAVRALPRTGLDGVPRPHHQHLQPAGRGAGDRISPENCCVTKLVADSGGTGQLSRRHGPAPASTRPPTTAACASTSPASARRAGVCSAAARVGTAGSRRGPGVVFEGDSAVLKTGQWVRRSHTGRRRLRPAPAKRDPAAAGA